MHGERETGGSCERPPSASERMLIINLQGDAGGRGGGGVGGGGVVGFLCKLFCFSVTENFASVCSLHVTGISDARSEDPRSYFDHNILYNTIQNGPFLFSLLCLECCRDSMWPECGR